MKGKGKKMKFFTKKEITKKIIISILLIMTFNFITPNYSQAAEPGGKLFNAVFEFVTWTGDLALRAMQKIFMGDDNLFITGTSQATIKYSPGVIFSNKVPSLDINFFNPHNKYETRNTSPNPISDRIMLGGTLVRSHWYKEQVGVSEDNEAKNYKADGSDLLEYFMNAEHSQQDVGMGVSGKIPDSDDINYTPYSASNDVTSEFAGVKYEKEVGKDKYWEGIKKAWKGDNGEIMIIVDYSNIYTIKKFPHISDEARSMTLYKVPSLDKAKELINSSNNYNTVTTMTTESSAQQLQETVATWYKTLRAVALVGLLSVLVYIGIRILIGSTGQEKAKYKKMIIDWVAAVCILFVLQYIMVFTLKASEMITDMLSVNVLDANGYDTLVGGIREEVGDLEPGNTDYSNLTKFTNVVIYLVLVIHTGIFSVFYLKRLIYMAFFTMIAPLIALTYPLDKVKDGQAQAFTTWIREYIFNALIQPVHLLIYFMFVTSAADLADENPIYAVVAIGFLIPAEKFFRKMFGFEKASSVSPVGAAAGGALVMNAINKMGQKSGKQAAGKGDSDGGNGSGSAPTRYIPNRNTNPGGGNPGGGNPGGGNPGGGNPGGGNPGGGNPGGGNPGGGNPGGGNPGGGNPGGGNPGGGNPGGGNRTMYGQTINNAQYARSQRGAGLRTVSGKYFNRGNFGRNGKVWKAAGRGIRKGIVGAAGATALGTIGFAAGVATGDVGNALKFGAAGATAGFVGANRVGDKATEIEKTNRELYKEGKWGTQEYNTRNSIKQLTNDNDFNSVCKNLGITNQQQREAIIRQFHSNGITKAEDIKKAMNVRAATPGTSQDAIIAAQKIRQEATKYGMKRKDIESKLQNDGVSQSDIKTVMNLIDQL